MSETYSALLIDDEEASLEMLEILLKKNCPQISEIHLANNAQEASVMILRKKPDIVFTDIKMPGLSGIDLLNSFPEKNFKSIIVTAFPDFGIEAVKAGANDYLIKPIISYELIDAVQKITLLISKERIAITSAKIEPVADHKHSEKLLIKDLNGTILINYDDIIFFEAINNYTNIHCINGHKYLSPKTLKFHEGATHHPSFYRIHKSFLINVDYVDKYVAGNDRSLYLKGGHLVKVAVNKRGDFRRFLQRKM
jgi:two-component system, LytTR family, response regulator